MPLKHCEDDGWPGWKWGDAPSAKCYTYTKGDEASETAARKKAMAQAAAMGEFPGTGQRTAVVEHRSSMLTDVDKRQRLIDVIAVPWDQEADVLYRGDIWHESHDRHAYDGIQGHAGRIQANREHVKGNTVGRIVHADPSYSDGLFLRVKAYPTPLGDETLTLAEQGGAFPSIGFRVHRPSDQRLDVRTKTRRILKGFLDHLSFVEDPAYVGAEVLAVRAGQSGLTVVEAPLPSTPALDEWRSDPLLQQIADRFRQ